MKSLLALMIVCLFFLKGDYAPSVMYRVYSVTPPSNKNAVWVRIPDRTMFTYNSSSSNWRAIHFWSVYGSTNGTATSGISMRHTQAIQMDQSDECIYFPGDYVLENAVWNASSVPSDGVRGFRVFIGQYNSFLSGEGASKDTVVSSAVPGGAQTTSLHAAMHDCMRIFTLDTGTGSLANCTVWLYCREVVSPTSTTGVGGVYSPTVDTL